MIKNLVNNGGVYDCGNLIFGVDVSDTQFIADSDGLEVKNYIINVSVGGQNVIERKNQEA